MVRCAKHPVFTKVRNWMEAVAMIAVLMLAVSLAGAPPPACAVKRDASGSSQKAGKSSVAFAMDLLGHLAPGNMVVSPLSIQVGLAMAASGARGDTQAEMRKVLHLQGENADADMAALVLKVRARGAQGDRVNVANRIFVNAGLALHAEYTAAMCSRYGTEPVTVDFAGGEAVRVINAWVDQETRHRIPHLANQLPTDIHLVLANAVYFRGRWQQPFAKEATRRGVFHAPGERTKAWLMGLEDDFRYARIEQAKVLAMPYKGGLEMVIVLPDAEDGLPAVEKRASMEWNAWVRALSQRKVDVTLPRFHTRTSMGSMARTLGAMGMVKAFHWPGADFSGMGSEPFFVNDVLHEAVIEVDEQGTEAAAATLSAMGIGDMDERVVARFVADHPFLYVIREPDTGAILFLGRLVHPPTD